jgi:hypothetical protein
VEEKLKSLQGPEGKLFSNGLHFEQASKTLSNPAINQFSRNGSLLFKKAAIFLSASKGFHMDLPLSRRLNHSIFRKLLILGLTPKNRFQREAAKHTKALKIFCYLES